MRSRLTSTSSSRSNVTDRPSWSSVQLSGGAASVGVRCVACSCGPVVTQLVTRPATSGVGGWPRTRQEAFRRGGCCATLAVHTMATFAMVTESAANRASDCRLVFTMSPDVHVDAPVCAVSPLATAAVSTSSTITMLTVPTPAAAVGRGPARARRSGSAGAG